MYSWLMKQNTSHIAERLNSIDATNYSNKKAYMHSATAFDNSRMPLAMAIGISVQETQVAANSVWLLQHCCFYMSVQQLKGLHSLLQQEIPLDWSGRLQPSHLCQQQSQASTQ
ncbi:TPA: hypothetical protein ACH3X2_007969 [Trebouxia sp. C0005]